jgi:hypothetical protein
VVFLFGTRKEDFLVLTSSEGQQLRRYSDSVGLTLRWLLLLRSFARFARELLWHLTLLDSEI